MESKYFLNQILIFKLWHYMGSHDFISNDYIMIVMMLIDLFYDKFILNCMLLMIYKVLPRQAN